MSDDKKTFPMLLKATTGGGVQEWEIWVTRVQGDGGCINVRYGLKDGKKQLKTDTVLKGKNPGKKNATTGYEQACAEAQSKWNKQHDRKGYGLTVERSAAVRAASPMLAHKYKDHAKKVDWGSAFAQPKLDGFRCLTRITEDGDVTMTSRENQPFTALADMQDVIRFIAKNMNVRGHKGDVYIDGELYCHGMTLQDISSACKKKSDKTARLKYHLYDAIIGTADFKTRITFVQDFVRVADSELLVPVETVKVRSEVELMTCQHRFLEQGYEGAILRYGAVGYQAGKRSAHLLKVKTFEDDEFEVVDFKMGRGDFAGVPIFMCETKDGHTFEVTCPGTMPEKREIGKVAKQMIGRQLTVKYAYYTKTDEPVPFHPVAKAFRELKKGK